MSEIRTGQYSIEVTSEADVGALGAGERRSASDVTDLVYPSRTLAQ